MLLLKRQLQFNKTIPHKKKRKMKNSRKCETCKVNVHRASFVKLLRTKKQLETEKRNEMITPEWLFKQKQTTIKKKIRKSNPKILKQIARGKIKTNDIALDKKLAKKMINPYCFVNENLNNGFKINLESQNIIHANSFRTRTPIYQDFGFETIYINKILKEMAVFYARLINQYKFLYHILFSAIVYKIKEEDQRSDEIELFINLNINANLTENDIDKIDIKP